MSEKYDRLAQILKKLYQGEKLQISTLAKEFKTSTKTIQRDFKERLKSSFVMREGRYFRLKTLHKEEKDAFVLDILRNLTQGIEGDLKNDIDGIIDRFAAQSPYFCNPLVNILHKSEEILKIQKAILHQKTLSFSYQNKAPIQVKPLGLSVIRKTIFLSAIFELQERLFRLEKITHCKIGRKKSYAHSQAQNLQFVSLFVYPQASDYAQSLIWGEKQKIIKDKNQNLILEFFCPNLEMLTQEILSQSPHIIVLEPKSLRDEIEKRILLLAQKHQSFHSSHTINSQAHCKISISKK